MIFVDGVGIFLLFLGALGAFLTTAALGSSDKWIQTFLLLGGEVLFLLAFQLGGSLLELNTILVYVGSLAVVNAGYFLGRALR